MKSIHDGRMSDAAPRPVTLPTIAHSEATIKFVGPAVFRSEHARDFACLLDLDPEVARWSSAPPLLRDGNDEYQLDFVVITEGGSFLVDVGHEEPLPPTWVTSLAESMGHQYRPVAMADLEGSFRLRNAKDLLR